MSREKVLASVAVTVKLLMEELMTVSSLAAVFHNQVHKNE